MSKDNKPKEIYYVIGNDFVNPHVDAKSAALDIESLFTTEEIEHIDEVSIIKGVRLKLKATTTVVIEE